MAQKQEVAQLRKALEKERCAVRLAQDEVAALRAALDSERSAVRALRRDIANQIKKIKEEEAERYTTLIEHFKNRSSLDLEEKVKNQKEQVQKSITAEFQRLQQSREAELHREATRREDDLRYQLKDVLNRLNELTNKSVNSSQPVNSTNTSTNMAATSATFTINEIQALRAENKQLELRLQELLEAERRNAEKVRTQYEEHLAKEAEQEKSSRRESHILLEKLKSKDRTIEQLEKELRKLKGRLEASCRNCLDIDKPGEPPRLGLKKRLNIKTNGPASETARARCDLAKETNSNDLSDQQSSCDNSNSTNKETDTNEKEPEEKENSNELNGSENKQENETLSTAVAETNPAENSPVQETDITINSWTKAVGVETLYQVIVAEHQELQRAHQALAAKLRAEQKARADLEASIQQNRSENPINLALAAQIQELTARQAELISENHELREQNDLLEFRLLEIDSAPSSLHFKTPSSPSRSPESRGDREVDDISDSGVLSLPTSEDISETDFHELAMEPSNRDIKSKLSLLCQSMENISDRISIQQGLALLRHYEARLEATLATMSPDLTKSISEIPALASESTKSQSRIIATVLPFTDLTQTNGRTKEELPIKRLLKDADCLQESGIFEESPEYCCRWTQTDWSPEKLELGPRGDLSLEIRKLKQIRERIEEQGGNKRLLRSPGEDDQCQSSDLKELLFYRDRVEILENKLAIYESSGDEQIRRLNSRLEKEILLSAQLKHLKERCAYLEDLNRRLEEEKCEFEEAENDTRLRCQKLEVKLSALGEKKSDLQVQLQQNARSLANVKSCLAEEEKKRIEARQHASQMEALVQCYEQRNFELEEKEVEARCKNQMLEGTIPALIVYNTWKTEQTINNKMDKKNHSCGSHSSRMLPQSSKTSNQSNRSNKLKSNGRVKELYSNLVNLKSDLYKDCERLEKSRSSNMKNKASNSSVINDDDIEGCLNELKPVEEHLKSTFEDLDRTAQFEEEFLLQHSKAEMGRTTTPPGQSPSQSSYHSSISCHKPKLSMERKESAQTGRAIASQLKSLKCERDDLEAKIRNLKSSQSVQNKDSREQCSEIQDSAGLPSDLNESTVLSQKTNVVGRSQDGKEDLCSQLQKLKEEKDELEDKIKHLELKESYYKETLQQADEMWASMEQQYKDRIQCNESKLEEKQKELENVEARLLRLSREKNMSQQLNNRIYCLETEIKDLKFKLAERELDKKLFEKEEHRLCSELAGTSEELNFIKNCTEPRLRQQLSDQKRITEELRKEVEFLERSRKNDAADYSVEVSGLNRKISKLNKEVLENECTISELREEVQTLEIALTELRDKYLEEQDGRERLLIKLTKEIEDKERDIRLLKQKPAMLPKSAKEELEEAENSQIMLCSKNKRSKSERKHKTRCRMTLKKLNEKIKAGLLLDDNQFNSISSESSGDDSSNEIYVQNTLDFPYRSSLAELSDTSHKYINNNNNNNNNNSHDLSVNERISDLENDSEGLLDGDEPLSLRLSEEKAMDDDPHVDCEATEVVTSSKSSHEESKNHFEESINEQNLLTENTSETTSSTLRLSSSIKHSTKNVLQLSERKCRDPEEIQVFPKKPPCSKILKPAHNYSKTNLRPSHSSRTMRGKDCCKSLQSSGSVSSVDEYHSATSDVGEDEKQSSSSKPKRARKSKEDKNKDNCIEPTITSLLTTVKILQSKITSKDQLIQCLADQLVCLAEKGFCWNNCLTECIASYPSKRYVDFDCALLMDYLGGFVYYKPDDIGDNDDDDSKHPLNLKIIGATSYDSLLLSWTAPKDLEISGFDIYVNDELIERIRDPSVRKTLLHPIDLHEEITITICALDLCGVHILCDVICVPPVACDPPSSESLVKKENSVEEMPADTNEDQSTANEPEITTGDEQVPSDEPEITTEDNQEPSPVTEENENPLGEEQAPESGPEETIETNDSNG